MPMAILGWGGGVGNRGDLRDIPNTNEAHINWCSWVRGDGVGEKGGNVLETCQKRNRNASETCQSSGHQPKYVVLLGPQGPGPQP